MCEHASVLRVQSRLLSFAVQSSTAGIDCAKVFAWAILAQVTVFLRWCLGNGYQGSARDQRDACTVHVVQLVSFLPFLTVRSGCAKPYSSTIVHSYVLSYPSSYLRLQCKSSSMNITYHALLILFYTVLQYNHYLIFRFRTEHQTARRSS